jgi:hypothetical protein
VDSLGVSVSNFHDSNRFQAQSVPVWLEAVAAFLSTIIKRWHHKQMAHVLWQQRCLEVASRLHHVGVVDETRRTYRHHGRQRDAPRRIATFRHATLRVATHRYATLEPLGKSGGSRAFSANDPLNRLWLRDAYRSQPEAETEEI